MSKRIWIHGHGGSSRTYRYAEVPGIGTKVWVDTNDIANIISLQLLRQTYRITYDNWQQGPCFIVYKPNRQMLVLEESPSGLYCHDVKNRQMGDEFTDNSAISLVSTVAENMKIFSKRQVERTDIVRKPQPRQHATEFSSHRGRRGHRQHDLWSRRLSPQRKNDCHPIKSSNQRLHTSATGTHDPTQGGRTNQRRYVRQRFPICFSQ